MIATTLLFCSKWLLAVSILNLTAADKEGQVTVVVNGKRNLACKSIPLGETTIFYFDGRKKYLKEVVECKELFHEFLEEWNKRSTSRDNKLNSTSSGKCRK